MIKTHLKRGGDLYTPTRPQGVLSLGAQPPDPLAEEVFPSALLRKVFKIITKYAARGE
jgi:hypothetical protein